MINFIWHCLWPISYLLLMLFLGVAFLLKWLGCEYHVKNLGEHVKEYDTWEI